MMQLTLPDRKVIDDWLTQGVLVELDGNKIDSSGVILVCCSDGDQFDDKYERIAQLFKINGNRPRIHAFGWNGGALRLHPNSAANLTESESQIFRRELEDAIEMKGIKTIVLKLHFPCGKAHASDISAVEAMRLLLQTKQHLKRNLRVTVSCYCHVDFGQGKKQSYYVNRERFEAHYQLR